MKRLSQASNFSIMADECTDVTTIEELSIFFRWIEDGIPLEHFLEIVPLNKHVLNTIVRTHTLLRVLIARLDRLHGQNIIGGCPGRKCL